MKYGLSDKTIEKIHSVFKQYPQVEKAILYGSRATGNYRNGSDIDLTLCGEGLTHSVLTKIDFDLDDLLLPYTIDLSVFREINNPDMVEQIERVGANFHEKSEDV
ncbi:MAG: nucleotidyltransferase domain-containing protein [Candidatus Poribacteria bacterium]|nr:nucleotidyltransferase domain-containing protein [Candidatus Poribacteria bacterium]